MPSGPIVRERGEGPRFTKTLRVEGLQFKFDQETGEVEGFAAVMGHPDSFDEVIDNGAFKRTLREKKGRIPIAWQHNFREPIGKPTVLREVKREKLPEGIRADYPKATGGLYFKAQITDTRQGEDAMKLLRDGVVDEVSIGYDFFWKGDWEEGWETEGYYEGDDGYVHLREIDLYEFSLVTMAAQPAAQVVGYKSVGDAFRHSIYMGLPGGVNQLNEDGSWTPVDTRGMVADQESEPEPSTRGVSFPWLDTMGVSAGKVRERAAAMVEDPDQELSWGQAIDTAAIMALIELGHLKEANERLQILMAELSPEDPSEDTPAAVLGLAEELNLRAMALDLDLEALYR